MYIFFNLLTQNNIVRVLEQDKKNKKIILYTFFLNSLLPIHIFVFEIYNLWLKFCSKFMCANFIKKSLSLIKILVWSNRQKLQLVYCAKCYLKSTWWCIRAEIDCLVANETCAVTGCNTLHFFTHITLSKKLFITVHKEGYTMSLFQIIPGFT